MVHKYKSVKSSVEIKTNGFCLIEVHMALIDVLYTDIFLCFLNFY